MTTINEIVTRKYIRNLFIAMVPYQVKMNTHVKKFSRKSLCESMPTLDGNPNQMGRQIVWKSMLPTEIHSSSMESIHGNRFPFDFSIHPNQ